MRAPRALAGLALVVAGLPAAVPAHSVGAQTCQDKPVTISDADGGVVEGTDGDDVILVSGGDTDTIIDAMGGDDTICFTAGAAIAGAGRDSVQLGGGAGSADVGIQDAEDLDVSGRADGGPTYLRLSNVGKGSGSVRLGDDDAIDVIGKDYLAVDLRDDIMTVDAGTYSFVGEPHVFAVARRVVLTGDDADNPRLNVHQRTCKATISGGRGDDSLEVVSTFVFGSGPLALPRNCGRRWSKLYGQRGDDQLQGGRHDDVLIGGPGHDDARGGPGIDRCTAETKQRCER